MVNPTAKAEFYSEAELERLKTKDIEVMTRLVNTYTHELFNASLGLGFNENDSHDLVQNVWLTIFEKIRNFEGRSHIRTFIFGVLYRKAKEHRRESSRASASDQIEEILGSRFDEKGNWLRPPMNPEDFALGVEKANIIKHCMDGLNTPQRTAFYLKEVQGEDSKRICEVLEVSISNLGVLLYRARNFLRECIESKLEAGLTQGERK